MEEASRPGHLFKPGHSGNPAGKPKGAVSGRSRALAEVDRILGDEANVKCRSPGVTRQPSAAGGFGVVEDRGGGTAPPPVNTAR